MRYHLLSPEDREDLGESSRPRRKKHDYRIALFGGSQPQSCRYFNPKVSLATLSRPFAPSVTFNPCGLKDNNNKTNQSFGGGGPHSGLHLDGHPLPL